MKKSLFPAAIAGFVLGFWACYLSLATLIGYLSAFSLCLFLSLRKREGKAFFAAFAIGLLLCLFPLLLYDRGETGYFGVVVYSRDNYFLIRGLSGKRYVYSPGHPYELGDLLYVSGYAAPFEMAHYEGRFDFGEYLRLSGVMGELSPSGIKEILLLPIRLKGARRDFLSPYGEDSRALLDSLLFGIKDYDNGLIASGERMGALYFLSSSGFYYSLFLRCVEKLFSLKFEKRKCSLIALLAGTLYLPLAIGKIGILRVYLTRLFWAIDRGKTGRAREFAAATLLFLDPYNATNSGFLTGFAVSYFMSFSNPLLRNAKKNRRLLGRGFVLLLLLPSLSSGGELHLLSAVFSAVLVPAYFPFLLFGLCSFLIGIPFVSVLDGYAGVLKWLMGFLSEIDAFVPFVDLRGNAPVYYVFLYFLLYLLEIGFFPLAKKATLLALGMLLLKTVPVGNGLSSSVSFIDVGQGDSILIRNGYEAVLVDTGGSRSFDMAEEVLVPYLRKEGVYSLKALIITHGDFDHSGAVASLVSKMKVEKVLDSHDDFPFPLGGMTLESLNPGGFGEDNEDSLVLRFEMGRDVYLLTGDAGFAAENKMLEEGRPLDADILKLGHHGSKGSSSMEFLKEVSPRVAVISCGEGNYYDHPDEETLKRLNGLGIDIRRTDEEGTIVFFYPFAFLSLGDMAPIGKESYNRGDDPGPLFPAETHGDDGPEEAIEGQSRGEGRLRFTRGPPF